MNDIAELKRLAEAATPGPWHVSGYAPEEIRSSNSIVRAVARRAAPEDTWDVARRDAEYIAAANPQAIMALIERLETAENEAEQLRVQLAACTVAALGYAKDGQVCQPGDYGYSASFGDVKNLRAKHDRLAHRVRELKAERRGTVRLTLEQLLTVERVFKDWNRRTGVVNAPPPNWLSVAIKEAQGE